MFLSHFIWYLRTRGLRQRATAEGQTFDECEEAVQWQAKGIDLRVTLTRLCGRGSRAESTSANNDVEAAVQEPISTKDIPYGTV